MKLGVHRNFRIYAEVDGVYPLTQRDLRTMLAELMKARPDLEDVVKEDLLRLSEDISEMARRYR
jgi:hypothetical protein